MAMEVSAPNTAVRVSWTCDRGMEPKLWSIGEETPSLMSLFYGVKWTPYSISGKKSKVLTVKSREVRRTSDKHIAWPKQTRLVRREVRRTSKCSSNNSETAGSNCFKVFWKILLQQKFLARTISWSTKRPQKLWKQRTKHLNVTIDDVTGTTIGKSSIQWRSLKWRWLVEWSGDRGVIYRAAKRRDKNPPPGSDTVVNNCFNL